MTELNQESAPKTLGQVLTEAREACQFNQQDLADKLCLSISVINDMENDSLTPEINAVFTKGYIKSYAREVDLNQDVVLELFEHQNQSNVYAASMQSFSQRNRAQSHNNYLAWVTTLILITSVVMSVMWWWQQRIEPAQDDGVNSLSSVRMKTQELAAIVPALTNVLATESAAAIDEQRIDFSFYKDCWVKVTDASNEVLAIGIKKSGTILELTGIAPFEVTLGAPKAVTIQYQESEIDISQFITDKNARFYVPME